MFPINYKDSDKALFKFETEMPKVNLSINGGLFSAKKPLNSLASVQFADLYIDVELLKNNLELAHNENA